MSLRISIFLGSFAGGGIERAVLSILRSSALVGHDIEVICLRATGALRNDFKSSNVPVIEFRLHFWNMPWVIWRLFRHLRRNKRQLIHSNGYHADVIARIAAYYAGIHCINTLHANSIWKREPVGFYQHWMRTFDIFTARRYGRWFIALSDSIKEFHIHTLHYPPTSWRIIPNPIDTGRLILGQTAREETRMALGVEQNAVLCIATGNLLPVKGHKHLIEAVRLLPDEFKTKLHLSIAGEGPERQSLEKKIRELAMGGRIKLLGYTEEIGNLLHAADLFIMPSISEGQSLAILEAMICGKPMIVTSMGAHMDYLRHGINAMIVPPGDPQALMQELVRLISDIELRKKLGIEAKKTIATMPVFNAVNMIEECWREIIN